MPRNLPEYLRSERRRAGLSQEDVAALLGAGLISVRRYEQRKRLPALEIALAYEAVLGVPVADLFGRQFEEIRKRVRERATRRSGNLGRVKNPRHIARRKESLQLISAR